MKKRLHVVLAHAGVASRRKSEDLISRGLVQVNGKTVKEQGIQVDPEKDTIIVEGKKLPNAALKYYLLNKPRGVVSTVSDPEHGRTVIDIFEHYYLKIHGDSDVPRVYPVGRLDKDSEGLMLLTNDGDLAYKLTHPKFEVPKTYEVLIKGSPGNTQLTKIRKGVKLKEGFSVFDEVEILKHDEGNTWLRVVIHQGLYHQIRRSMAVAGLEVRRLVRKTMGNLDLGKIKSGEVVEIEKPL